jgi:hypothetical protein
LCTQLKLISSTKYSWSAAGQLVHNLRPDVKDANPFILDLEAAALLRQVLDTDGLLIRELLKVCLEIGPTWRREDVSPHFPDAIQRALESVRSGYFLAGARKEGKQLLGLIERDVKRLGSGSKAPGVLEHRLSPRLEWLTDFGAFSKPDRRKNSFEYSTTSDGDLLCNLLHASELGPWWAAECALAFWRHADCWIHTRRGENADVKQALILGYRVMQRTVGPAPIREIVFAAGLLSPRVELKCEELANALVQWADQETGITVSGGRYSRDPELVHMSDHVLLN